MAASELLADRFELESVIATSGMASVFRGADVRTGQPVAVKIIEGGGRLTARFEREVLALERLRHPGIVGYVAHGETPEGKLFLAMEWLSGDDLATVLSRGPLGVRESLVLAHRIASALGEAHRHGIVHRDVKPSNVFLVGGDVEQAKLLDFGVARLAGASRHVTHTGILVGTPGYLAPEQARGDRGVDARADVFSVGCVLFECIAGRPAFEADRVLALLAKVLFAGAPRLSDVALEIPEGVDELVAELMKSEPDARPADGDAVAERIARLLESGELRGRRRSSRAPAFGQTEQQLLSVVIAAGARIADGRTMSMADIDDRHAALREVSVQCGARFEPVVDGSAVMTLSGRGDAREQAARAARCALAAQRAAPDLSVAVATGSGVMEGAVPAGEVIDRAVAVVDVTGAEVCADDVTAGLLGDEFEVVHDDGRRVVRERQTQAAPARTLLGREIPCMGRTRELRMIEAVASQSFDESAAAVVILTGPAGAGKSRVREEIARVLGERGASVWVGRGEPMRTGSPFSLVASALAPVLGGAGQDDRAAQRRAIEERVRAVVPTEHHGRVSYFLGELIGAPFDDADDVRLAAARREPELMADQIRAAIVDFACGCCAEGPLLLVLDDLHWADAPSVRAIDQLLSSARDLPLLVMGVARGEVFERFPDLWSRRVPQEIKIGPLPRRAAEELVRAALGDDTADATVERLLARSQGNVFFLEELIRAEAAGRGEETPATLLAVVRARLEAMEPEARRLMRGASVFGTRFFRAGLSALVGRDPSPWVERLEEREVFARAAAAGGHGEPDLSFRHDLMRDAAYAMLTEEDRVLGHRLAAQWLAGRPGIAAVTLAEHFERGGLPEDASRWWVVAASEALEGNDLDACLRCVERARDEHLDDATRGRARLLAAEAQIWRGAHASAEVAAGEAMALLPHGSDAWCQACMELVTARSRHGAHEVEAIAEELLAATAHARPTVLVCSMLARLALTLRHGGLPALARRVTAIVREAMVGLEDPVVAGWLHRVAASEALFDGDLGTYFAEELASRDAFAAVGATRRSVLSAVNVGYALLECGAYAEAERALLEAAAATRRIGLGHLEIVADQNLGRALAANGRLREGIELERKAAAAAAELGDVRLEGGSLVYLAGMHLELGELLQAETRAREAVDRLLPVATLWPYARAMLARTLLAQDRLEEALGESEEAMRGLGEVGDLEEGEPLVRLVRGESLARAGRSDEAAATMAGARELIEARAARIRDAGLRRSFRERVPDNARILGSA